MACRGRPGRHPDPDRDAGLQRQPLVPACLRLRRRLRLLPAARDRPARGDAARSRRGRAGGGRRHRPRALASIETSSRRCSDEPSGTGVAAPALDAGNGAGGAALRLGGMALRNGLLIHGPRAWAAAARTRDGAHRGRVGPQAGLLAGRLGSTPLLRGPLRLAEAFAVVPLARRRLPAARLPIEDPRVLVVGIATAAVSGAIRRLGRHRVARRRHAAGGRGRHPGSAAGGGRASRSRPGRVPRRRAQGDRRL